MDRYFSTMYWYLTTRNSSSSAQSWHNRHTKYWIQLHSLMLNVKLCNHATITINNKSSAVAEMGDHGHNRHGPKRGGAVPLREGVELEPHLTQCCPPEAYLRTKWHLDPSSHLATIYTDRKVGAVSLFRGVELGPHLTQCGLHWGLPPYQVLSWSIQPSGHNRHGPKIGGGLCPFWGGKLGPHLWQCGLGRGLPPYQVASWCIQQFGHNRNVPKIEGAVPPFLGRGI